MDRVALFNPATTTDGFFTPREYIPFWLIFTNQSNWNILVKIATDIILLVDTKSKIAFHMDERVGYTPRSEITWQRDVDTPQQTGIVGYLIIDEAKDYEWQHEQVVGINAS